MHSGLQLQQCIGIALVQWEFANGSIGHDAAQLAAGGFDLDGVRLDCYRLVRSAQLQSYGDEVDVADGDDNILGDKLFETLSVGRDIVGADGELGNVEGAVFVRRYGARGVRAGERSGDGGARHYCARGIVYGAANFAGGLSPGGSASKQAHKHQ